MANEPCFVQFPHPGGEHKPDREGRVGWNKTHRENGRINPHRRKFLQFRGKWIDKDGNTQTGNLRAWAEWEPESKVSCVFDPKDGRPHHPRYLWSPFYVPKGSYTCLHNTDPFIFDDCFFYSNCGQSTENKRGLKELSPGSVIAFGSGKKIDGRRKWVLDTVFVVKDSRPYDPLNPREALEGKVPDAFLEVTGGPLIAWAEELRKGSASAACGPTSERLQLYWGATPDDPVNEMFSFFPAVPEGRGADFLRPAINLPDEYFNPGNRQSPKGHGRKCEPDKLRWDSLVAQVRKADLVLGTRAEMPERRAR